MATEYLRLASTIIPNQYDGDSLKLTSFIDSLTLLQTVTTDEQLAIAFVKTRLTGKARDAITTETTIAAISRALQNQIKVPSSEEISLRLKGLKMSENPSVYVKEVDKLAEELKRSYLTEGVTPASAEKYVTREVTSTLIAAAPNQHVKTVMEAKSFEKPSDVSAKFVDLMGTVQTQQILKIHKNKRYTEKKVSVKYG